MELSRRSKIRDVWQHPVGHDVLARLLKYLGRKADWPEKQLVANFSINVLDRLAGEGFVDALLALCAQVVLPGRSLPASMPDEPAWWKEAVIYQVYLPSFMDSDHDGMGDLAGLVQRLPYLSALGVDVLWVRLLMDISDGGCRSLRDLRKIGPEFGDEKAFKQFVNAAHQRGMKVMMGFDLSCTCDKNVWFTAALKTKDLGAYYVIQKGLPGVPPNNWEKRGQSVWKWYAEPGRWVLRLLGDDSAELNWDNPAMRQEMCDVVRFWREEGVDGFYFGSANYLSKANYKDANKVMGEAMGGIQGYEKVVFGPRLYEYLQEVRTAAGAEQGAFVAGEIRNIGTGMAGLLATGKERVLDLVLNGEHMAVQMCISGEDGRIFLQDLKNYYLQWMKDYAGEGWMGLLLESADTPRMVSRLGAPAVYRSILAKLLGTMLFTLRGVPILYQGEELGMGNTRFAAKSELRDVGTLRLYDEWAEKQGKTEAMRRVAAVTPDNARTPFPWNGLGNAGFTGARPWIRLPDGIEYLNAAVQMEDANSVWNYYRKLIELRKLHRGLVYGSFRPVFTKNKRVFCYFRMHEGEKWYVEMNLTDREVPRPGRIPVGHKLLLSNYAVAAAALRPYEANLYLCE